MNDTIESRPLYSCACSCGTEAVMSRFRIVRDGDDRFPVLPEHEEYFYEKLAATKQLLELVGARKSWLWRLRKATTIYRLQTVIRHNRPLARRSAVLFALPKPIGLRLGRLWKIA